MSRRQVMACKKTSSDGPCIWNVLKSAFMEQPNNLWMLVNFLNVFAKFVFLCVPSVEDLCESAAHKPEWKANRRPVGHPHGLSQPHLGPLDLHPAQKDSGAQADGEDQVSILQNGRAGARERRAVPLCRRPPQLLHRLPGLSLTGVTGAPGIGEHLSDLPLPVWGKPQEVISSGGAVRLQSAICTDVTRSPGGRGASEGAFTEWFRGRHARQATEWAPSVPQGLSACDFHRWDCKHTREMHMRGERDNGKDRTIVHESVDI